MSRLLPPLLLVAPAVPLLALLMTGAPGGWEGPLRDSLLTAAVAAGLATLLGGLAGLGLRGRVAGRLALILVIGLPLLVPPALSGAALLMAAERAGQEAGWPAAALLHGLMAAPLVAVILHAALGRVRPALFRAAAACGAPPELAAKRLLRPRILPALVTGAALSFALSLGETGLALLLGAGTLPVAALPGGAAPATPILPLLVAALLVLVLVRGTELDRA